MARPKGMPKTGGRAKGTPNKVTTSLKEWISLLIEQNREQIVQDLTELEPKERLQFLLKLMEYIIPKAKEEEKKENTDGCVNLIRQSIIEFNRINEQNKA